MPCFKIEYAFVSNKSQRRSRSSLLRSSPAQKQQHQQQQTPLLQAGLPPGCADNDSQFSTGWSHLRVRRLLGNCYNLFHISCGCCLPHTCSWDCLGVCVCVWKFTSLRFSQKTTNEFRPARQNLFAYLNYYWNETKPNQNNITKALPKKCYPFSCFLFFFLAGTWFAYKMQ